MKTLTKDQAKKLMDLADAYAEETDHYAKNFSSYDFNNVWKARQTLLEELKNITETA